MVAQAIKYEHGESEASRGGTAAHWALSEVLGGQTVAVGQVPPNHFVLTTQMVDAAEDVKAWLDALIAKHGEQPHIWIEQRLSINRVHPQCWGTADLIVYFPRLNLVYAIDYKFGHGWVEVFEGWQVICYTAGALEKIQTELNAPAHNTKVVLVIIQPRSYHPDGSIRMWEMTAEGLRPYFQTLNAAARAAVEPGAKLTPGTHCRDFHCDARHACPALQNEGLKAVDRSRSAVPFNLPNDALGVELTDLRRTIKMLEARETGLAGQAEALITRGERVPFFTLERKPGNLEWTSPVMDVIEMGKLLGADLRKPVDVITPTQAKKLIGDEVVAGLASRPPGMAKLVAVDDTSARKIFT